MYLTYECQCERYSFPLRNTLSNIHCSSICVAHVGGWGLKGGGGIPLLGKCRVASYKNKSKVEAQGNGDFFNVNIVALLHSVKLVAIQYSTHRCVINMGS